MTTHCELIIESTDHAEIVSLDGALRGDLSPSAELLRSAGVGSDLPPVHRLTVRLHEPLDDTFRADVATLFRTIHRWDPDGHWHLSRRSGAAIGDIFDEVAQLRADNAALNQALALHNLEIDAASPAGLDEAKEAWREEKIFE
jgi:hypothetical protein